MPALFVFLLKVNIALLLFCAGYYLVLRHLTFYTLNRVYLLAAILFASIYPQINLTDFLQRHEQLARPMQRVVINWQAPAQALAQKVHQPAYWLYIEAIFWIGAALLATRLLVQLFSLYKLFKNSQPATIGNHNVRVMDEDAAPFSFWQSIFVNPTKHEPADLKAILLHEQVHVNQWHTADILLAELSSIFYWFNPGIWLMKRAIRENIEFITDQKILKKGIDSKAYQYSLVSVSFSNTQPGIVNHFNLSTIKKRIIMMNAKRSSKINLTRYAFMVPAVIGLLLVFSISKADFVKKSKAFKTITIISNNVGNVVGINHVATSLNAMFPDVIKIKTDTASKSPNSKTDMVRKQFVAIKEMPDTLKKSKSISIVTNDDSILVYVNGKKGSIKDVDYNNILSMIVLDAKSAAKLVSDDIGNHRTVGFITTKDSPEGLIFKEKLEPYYGNKPSLATTTVTGFNGSPLKGKVDKVIVYNVKIDRDSLKTDADGNTVIYSSNVNTTQSWDSKKSTPATLVYVKGSGSQKPVVVGSKVTTVRINGKTTTSSGTATGAEIVPDDEAYSVSGTGTVNKVIITDRKPRKLQLVKGNVITLDNAAPRDTIVMMTDDKSADPKVMKTTTSTWKVLFRTDSDEAKASPLILVDGKEVTQAEFKKIDPAAIKNISVIKNDAVADKKYGEKAKQGLIVIELKKKK